MSGVRVVVTHSLPEVSCVAGCLGAWRYIAAQ